MIDLKELPFKPPYFIGFCGGAFRSIPVSRSLEMIAEARKIRVSACFLPKERVIGQNVLVKSGLKP